MVHAEYNFAVKAAKDGLLEPIDFSAVKKADLDPRFVNDNGVGSVCVSFATGFNTDALGAKAPKNWADVFNTTSRFSVRRLLWQE